jgi:hypothetical protein
MKERNLDNFLFGIAHPHATQRAALGSGPSQLITDNPSKNVKRCKITSSEKVAKW